jgi:peptide deformylase
MTQYSDEDFVYRDLVANTDPILRQETPRFNFSDPPMDPHELAHTLAQTMIKNDGMGLAAPQIGLPYRVFVVMANPILCCFNPRIVDESEDTLLMEEGCLSYPGLYVKIRRPQVIRIRYTRPDGETVTEQYQDLTARVMQHELDHLDGICHLNRANKIHLDQARTRMKKTLRQNKKSSIIIPDRQIYI